MNVSLGERWEGFVADIVGQGRYGSASGVVPGGLRLVEGREAKVMALAGDWGASVRAGGGEPGEGVLRAAREWKAVVVYWNRDYAPGTINRDRAVQQGLAQIGVIVRTFKDHVVFEAEEVRSATGKPMQRYSAYRARWWTQWQPVKPTVLPVPRFSRSEKAA